MNLKSILLISIMISTLIAADTIFYGDLTLGNVDHVNVLSPVRNQNQPKPCGASWAFALAGAMSDQFNSIRSLEFPEVVLSPQMLLTCHSTSTNKTCKYSNSIEDADLVNTLNRLKEYGISDESCNNWHSNDQETCSNLNKCKDCANGENIHNEPNCFSRDYHSYKLKNFEDISNDKGVKKDEAVIRTALISALNSSGPVMCNIKHSEDLFNSRISQPDLYTEGQTLIDYGTWVSVVGFIDSPKNTDKTKDVNNLWVVKLSFGDNVGHYGYIYLNADEGQNDLKILDNCYSLEVNPDIKVVPNSDKKYKNLLKPMIRKSFDITKPRFEFMNQHSSKVSADSGLDDDKDYLDTPIFWGNNNGRNYLTWIKNQHIPTYCGSCWAQAATSVLNDRLNIMNINNNQSFPRHVLSVQAIINCNLGGTCLGGDSGLAWERAKQWKIPTDTCKVYESANPEDFSCDGKSRCSNASKEKEWAINEYNGVTVKEWKMVRGADDIKKNLLDGPIACSFEVTDDFENYKPVENSINVFSQQKDYFEINHAVSIVGWGKDDKGDYWIVRNSWGVEYGYNGLFYIRAGNVLGMEAGCQVPTKFTFSNWE
jgi:cathepsin X